MAPTMTGSLLRTLTTRPDPEAVRPSVAKTISTLAPQIVAPAAADPAVLVDVHSDLRLSLARLASENQVTLAERYLVTRLATGCIDLAPDLDTESTGEVDGPSHEFGVLSVDRRSRLRLTRALLGRLAVPVGSKVLVTFQPDGETLRLLNLATLADAVESQLAAATDGGVNDTDYDQENN